MSKFLQWLKERYNENDSYAITTLDIREYQGYLINIKKYAPAGVQQRIISILSYCKFLYDKKYLKIDLTANLKLIQVQSKDTGICASELINLDIKDISISKCKGVVHVRQR